MKRTLPFLILSGCLGLFAFGLVELFELRFAGGDVYPAYSSLRADPLGTMALYESLGQIPGIAVRRDFTTANRLPAGPGTVYLHLAASRHELERMPAELMQELKQFLARGGRLVLAYAPQTGPDTVGFFDEEPPTNAVKSLPAKARDAKPSANKPAQKKKKSPDDEREMSLSEAWNFHAGFRGLFPQGNSYEPVRVVNRTDLPLPAGLNWHSGMIFTNCDPQWKTIYARGTNAVVLERKFGPGSVVLATDSYFVSNEAMSRDRHADLLAWLVGPGQNVVFDEAHLGITDTAGVVSLMWKYHLQALLAGLLLLAGLFIWKNASSLVPPPAQEGEAPFVAGKDAAGGFVNLLRRSLPPQALLTTGFAEWKKSIAPGGAISAARRQAAEQILAAENARPPKARNPVAAYRKISETLQPKNL
jgi:hypothetical protein